MGFLFKKRGNSIPHNATFRLTQEGRQKLQQFSGDPKSQVLTALETEGTSSVDEISIASGLNKGQVERLVPTLIAGGYIQYISASMAGAESDI